MCVVSRILTIRGADNNGGSITGEAAEGSPGLLAIGLGCRLFVLEFSRTLIANYKPQVLWLVEVSCSSRMRRVKKP